MLYRVSIHFRRDSGPFEPSVQSSGIKIQIRNELRVYAVFIDVKCCRVQPALHAHEELPITAKLQNC